MFSKRVENAVGKGEIAYYEQFLLFPQCFQKTSTTDTWKPRLVCERDNDSGRSLLKAVREKEKILLTSIFSFSHDDFHPIKKRIQHFSNIKFVVCKCFQIS